MLFTVSVCCLIKMEDFSKKGSTWLKWTYSVPLQLLTVTNRRLSDWIRISYEIAFVLNYQSVHFIALKLIHVWNKAELSEKERGGERLVKEISLQYMSELLQGCKHETLAKDVECFGVYVNGSSQRWRENKSDPLHCALGRSACVFGFLSLDHVLYLKMGRPMLTL